MYTFSIIVPLYDNEEYLSACLSSVQEQTYTSWELIVVDDGSTDGGLDIVKQFAAKDSRVKYISQPNSGVSVARNVGLHLASENYVVFLDSDDLLAVTALEEVNRVIGQYHPDFVFLGNETFGDKHVSNAPKRSALYKSLHEWYKSDSLPVNISGGIFRREIIQQFNIKFTPGITHAEDKEFIIKFLVHSSSFYTLSRPLYLYRVHRGSTSEKMNAYNHKISACLLKVSLNLLDYICHHETDTKNKKDLTKYIKSIVKSYFVYLLNMPAEFYQKEQQRFRSFFGKVSKLSPSFSFDLQLRIAQMSIDIYVCILRNYIILKRKLCYPRLS